MPTREAWEQYWRNADTPWDLKGVTPALIAWVSEHDIKKQHILVPGCGQGHDAYFLAKHGAKVTAVDFSASALAAASERYQHANLSWLQADVLNLEPSATFDRIWEYTCFCALEPTMRQDYFRSLAGTLKIGGSYWGMVFTQVPNPEDGPPFQVTPTAFTELLKPHFGIDVLEKETERSVKPRRGSELWFEAIKK